MQLSLKKLLCHLRLLWLASGLQISNWRVSPNHGVDVLGLEDEARRERLARNGWVFFRSNYSRQAAKDAVGVRLRDIFAALWVVTN